LESPVCGSTTCELYHCEIGWTEIEANQLLTDHFRCPDGFADFTVTGDTSADSGYFRFGSAGICYGQCTSGTPAEFVTDSLHDTYLHVSANGSSVQLPFDAAQVVDNLRYERYLSKKAQDRRTISSKSLVRDLYYLVRPLMPVAVRKHVQRLYLSGWDKIPFPNWPVDFTVENIFEQLLVLAMKSKNVERLPIIWFWPDGASSCAIVTHDVETSSGRDFCPQLMDLNDSFGIKTAFQIVPEKRYGVPQALLDCIRERGFELNVHDLNHDGHLMEDQGEFLRRAKQINLYGRRFGAQGFRSAMLYRNIDWYEALDFSYDMSVPNVAHLDPQRGGCCTVFPFFNGKILELPVTMTQDYSLFHILNDYSIDVWKEQISLIREKHGLMQMIIHPDYVREKDAQRVYTELLSYLCELRARGETWIALPSEVAAWWRLRNELRLVCQDGSWHIEGDGSERARIAYASMVDEKIRYEFEPAAREAGSLVERPLTAL
jgi:hypothetical protein